MILRLAVLAVLASSCNFGECLGDAVGSGIGLGVGVSLSETWKDEARRDTADRVGTELWVTGAHEGGRMVLVFATIPVAGALPRSLPHPNGSCEVYGDYAWLLGSKTDGGVNATLNGTLAVTSMAPTDAGTPMVLELTGLTANLPDGGTRPVSDRTFSFVMPPP